MESMEANPYSLNPKPLNRNKLNGEESQLVAITQYAGSASPNFCLVSQMAGTGADSSSHPVNFYGCVN